MISHVEKGKRFQEKCKQLFDSKLGKSLENEVRITVSDGRSHVFDLATAERDIVAECKAYTWTKSGNQPSAKITHLREAVDLLNHLPESAKAYLLIKKDSHPVRKETLASYFVRLNMPLLRRVNVLEVSDEENEISCLHGNLQVANYQTSTKQITAETKIPALTVSELGTLRRSLFVILDNVEGAKRRDEGPAKRASRLRSEAKLPRNIANLMHTVLGFRDAAEYEDYTPTESETAAILNAWNAIVEWAKSQRYF